MKTRGFEIVKGWESKDVVIPQRKTPFSACYDLEAASDTVIPVYKPNDKPTLIPTGLKAYMQNDEVLIIVPRSSTPKKLGLTFPHNVGVIDADYYENIDNDGHIYIQVINLKDEEILVKQGTPVAQGMFIKYLTTDKDIPESDSRVGGFGSTDKK